MVTGASSGIGRATAELLASEGHPVFAAAHREHELFALAREHPRVTPLVVDVTNEPSVDAAYKKVDSATGGEGLDVLVNAAGNMTLGPVEATPDTDARRQFEVSLFGLLSVTRAVVPSMQARGTGRIVNVSSVMGTATASPRPITYGRQARRAKPISPLRATPDRSTRHVTCGPT